MADSPQQLLLLSAEALGAWLQGDASGVLWPNDFEESAASCSSLEGPAAKPLILEATDGDAEHGSGHIPGAVLVDLGELDFCEEEAPGFPAAVSGNLNLLPPETLRRRLEAVGVQSLRPTVVYTQCVVGGVANPIVASRLAWCLCYAGVKRVAILNGGMFNWRNKAGLDTVGVSGPRPEQPVDFFHGLEGEGLQFPLHPEFEATTEEVEAVVDGGVNQAGIRVVLADVRSECEYLCGPNQYPYPVPRGRIPGARWARWGPSTYVGGDFFDLRSSEQKPLEFIKSIWRKEGIVVGKNNGAISESNDASDDPDSNLSTAVGGAQRLVFYCGSGWRSSFAWCLARLAGHEDCANYDGGFLEWARNHPGKDHPVEVGPLSHVNAAASVCAAR